MLLFLFMLVTLSLQARKSNQPVADSKSIVGGQTVERKFLLNEFPVYVKAGAIIPMYPHVKNLQQQYKDLIFRIFPGGTGAFVYTSASTEKLTDGSIRFDEYALNAFSSVL